MENQSNKQENEQSGKQKLIGVLAMEAGIEFAAYIAVPLLAFVFLGKWLDKRYNHHFFVLIGIFTALFISSYAIYKRIRELKELLQSRSK